VGWAGTGPAPSPSAPPGGWPGRWCGPKHLRRSHLDRRGPSPRTRTGGLPRWSRPIAPEVAAGHADEIREHYRESRRSTLGPPPRRRAITEHLVAVTAAPCGGLTGSSVNCRSDTCAVEVDWDSFNQASDGWRPLIGAKPWRKTVNNPSYYLNHPIHQAAYRATMIMRPLRGSGNPQVRRRVTRRHRGAWRREPGAGGRAACRSGRTSPWSAKRHHADENANVRRSGVSTLRVGREPQ